MVTKRLAAELKQYRRAALLRDITLAEAEVESGRLTAYDNADDLMASLRGSELQPSKMVDWPHSHI